MWCNHKDASKKRGSVRGALLSAGLAGIALIVLLVVVACTASGGTSTSGNGANMPMDATCQDNMAVSVATADCDGDDIANSGDTCPRVATVATGDHADPDMDGMGNLCDPDDDGDMVLDTVDIDADGDGLIEIGNLAGLNTIRYNLDGTSHKKSADAIGSTNGAPTMNSATVVCDAATNGAYLCGYELTADIALSTASDWMPIGRDSNPGDVHADNGCQGGGFGAIFEGNGRRISALKIRGSGSLGLFACIEGATIRNVTIDGVDIVGSSSTDHIGALSGGAFDSSIDYVTIVDSDDETDITSAGGDKDKLGGLVGNARGDVRIFAAMTILALNGDNVGSLVGDMRNSILVASTARGSNSGTTLSGGLVGNMLSGTVLASHASVNIHGGGGLGGFINNNSLRDKPSIVHSLSSSMFMTSSELQAGFIAEANRITIVASYWDTTVDNLTSGSGAIEGLGNSSRETHQQMIGLTTAQLQMATVASSAVGMIAVTDTDCQAALGTSTGSCSSGGHTTRAACKDASGLNVWTVTTCTADGTIYSGWHSPVDIDNEDADADLTTEPDPESICYDADNRDGDYRWDTWEAGSAKLIWKLDTGTAAYPCVRPLDGVEGMRCSDTAPATASIAACNQANS